MSFQEDKAVRELIAKVQVSKTRGVLQNVGRKIQNIQNEKRNGNKYSFQSILNGLNAQSSQSLCSDEQQKELQKEVKRKYKEMKQLSTTSFQKFLSVYRFKTCLSQEEKLKLIEEGSTINLQRAFNYQTSMHYYKRELSPVPEGMASNHFHSKALAASAKSPYEANLAEYEGSIVTQSFKDNMLQQLGTSSICQT